MTSTRILTASIAALLVSGAIQHHSHAVDITWDTAETTGIQGGTGPWDNTTTNWTTDGGLTRNAWNNTANATDIAVFSAPGGTVTLANPISLGGLKFTTADAAYTITGQTLAFGSGQGSIDTSVLNLTTVTTVASALTGTGGLTVAGHGNLSRTGGNPARLVLSGDNTGLSGGISITAGLVDFTTQNAAGANALSLSNNAGLVHTSGALTLSNAIDIAATGGTIRNWSSAVLNVTGLLSGSGNLNITDTGVTTLGSHTGSSGTAVSTSASTLTGKVIINGGGTLGITGDRALGAVPASFTADSIQLGSNSTLMNMTGATGTTSFGNGFDVTLDANRGITLVGTATSIGKIRVGYNKTFTINGVITGGGSLTKTDNGTVVLTASNTYTGKTTIEAGIVRATSLNSVTGGSASSSLGAPTTIADGTISMGSGGNAGTLSYTGAGETTDRVINLAGTTGGAIIDQSGDGLLKFTSNLTATGVGVKGLILTGNSSGTGEIAGNIVDGTGTSTTGVTKTGSGTWTLSGTNTYTGLTTLSGGVLSFSNIGDTTEGGNLGTTGVLAFNSGTLQYTGATADTSRNMTISGGNGGTLELTQATTNFTTTGTLSGGASNRHLTKTGAGTLTLAGTADNVNGRAIVNAGILVLGKISTGSVHAVGSGGNADYALVVNSGGTARLAGTGGDQIFTNSSVRVNAGGTLDLNGQSEGFATLTDNFEGGLVTNAASSTTSTLTLGENNGSNATSDNYTFSGVIEDGAGTVALTKVGTGTQVLSGINTYTGATTVNAGTLLVNGSISGSAVTVNGGTLGGSGTVGVTTVNAGGTLAPGLAILTAGNTAFNGGTFALEISGTTAGTGHSQLITAGTFSLNGNTELTLNLGAFDPVDGVDTFTIVSNNLADSINTTNGLFTFGGTALGEGALFTVGSQDFTITYAGGSGNNDVVLAAVPEPSVAISLIGGLGLLLGLRRRKN